MWCLLIFLIYLLCVQLLACVHDLIKVSDYIYGIYAFLCVCDIVVILVVLVLVLVLAVVNVSE